MGLVVHVSTPDEGRIQRLMRRMFRRAKTMNVELLGEVGDVVRENNERVFASQGGFGGKPWAPLSPKYAAYKVRMIGNKPILVWSGRLRRSLTDSPMPIERLVPGGMEFGTDVPYAQFHQYGTSKMPARPPLQTNEWLNSELKRLVADHVVKD